MPMECSYDVIRCALRLEKMQPSKRKIKKMGNPLLEDMWRNTLQFCFSFIRTHFKNDFLNNSNQILQFSSVTQWCLSFCDPMDCSMPGLPVHHQLPELTQTHVHQVGDAIQPSHPLSTPSVFSLSQHQGLFQWVSSSHQVPKRLEFQL